MQGATRRVCAAAVLAMLAPAATWSAEGRPSRDVAAHALLILCESDGRAYRAGCGGSLKGMHTAHDYLVRHWGQTRLYCYPPNRSLAPALEAFITWVKADRKRLSLPASEAFMSAMAAAYPCKGKSAN